MSLHGSMREYLADHPAHDVHTLASGFLAETDEATLRALLAEEFQHLIRSGVRISEMATLAKVTVPTTRTVAERSAVVDTIRAILDRPYHIGDGVPRRAGELTEAEWLTRKQMLEGQRAGLDAAIEACNRAVALIRHYRVTCLNEIEGEVSLAA